MNEKIRSGYKSQLKGLRFEQNVMNYYSKNGWRRIQGRFRKYGMEFDIYGEKEDECRMFLVSEKGDKVTELAADDKNWKDWLYPSPDGKWISYDSEGEGVKVRSEGTIWEVSVKDLLSEDKEH